MGNDDERRIAPRLDAVALVEVSSSEKEGRHGVARNMSETGLQIATRSKFSVGDRVELTVHGRSDIARLDGRVVRVDETPPSEAWRYRVAIELEQPLPKGLVEDGVEIATRLRGNSKPPSAP